jgi:alkylhydroperoxidase/carboxymuconolactone decarboxylase family protein YurZ
LPEDCSILLQYGRVAFAIDSSTLILKAEIVCAEKGVTMNIRKKVFDYEYEEVLDVKTREMIRVACAVAVGCPD